MEEVCSYKSTVSFDSAVQIWGRGQVVRVVEHSPSDEQPSSLTMGNESTSAFRLNARIESLSVSLVDQIPEELLLLSIDDVILEVCTGMGMFDNNNIIFG